MPSPSLEAYGKVLISPPVYVLTCDGEWPLAMQYKHNMESKLDAWKLSLKSRNLPPILVDVLCDS